ncbi:MAG: transposase, partial [Porticoccaceae bacterium]
TLVATKFNPKIKAFYQRLLEQGKPKMVAIIAAMRKLISILNVMIREQESWNENYNNA